MRVLVCGGRDYVDALTLGSWLGAAHKAHPVSLIIEGGATGADRLARHWAEFVGVPVRTFKADWALGPKAGPMRNSRMIEEGMPDLVIAFPGGKGTADMVRRARAAGIEVKEITEPVTGGTA